MLDEAGLTLGVDLQVLNMGFADLSDAIEAGRIEAVFVWDPWIENFVQDGSGEGDRAGHLADDARRHA